MMLFDQDGNRKYINALERNRLRIQAAKIKNVHERAFVLSLFHSGCRISEALALTKKSINHQEGVIVFRTLKQRGKKKYRAVPVPLSLTALLGELYGQRDPSQKLWNISRVTGWKIIKKCMHQAGLSGIKATPKGLRHSFAIHSISKRVPLPVVQRWLGHTKIDTTTCYLDFTAEDQRKFARLLWHAEDDSPSAKSHGKATECP